MSKPLKLKQGGSNLSKKKKRCPNGTRKNKKTGNCDPINRSSTSKSKVKTTSPLAIARKRCPKGSRKNKKTGNCDPTKKSSTNIKNPKKLYKKLKLVDEKLKKTSPSPMKATKKTKMSKSRKLTRKLKIVKVLKPETEAKQMDEPEIINGKKVYNEEFVDILGQLEDIMQRQGEPFRARAYHKAAEAIMTYGGEITEVKQVEKLPGIGKTIMNKLQEYIDTGKLNAIEKMKNNPLNVLTKVYGIGPKKAKQFIADGLDTIEKLKEHPEKLTAAQKVGVEYFDDIEKKIPRSEIDEYKVVFEKIFKESTPPGSKFEIVGSYRRGKQQSGDIDMIITNTENNKKAFEDFLDALLEKGVITHLLSRGRTKSLTLAKLPGKPARRVDLMYTPPIEYAFAILYFTGSKAFNTMQRQRALDLGYTLNEHGMHAMKNGNKGAKVEGDFPDEKSIFKFLGMKYREPNERRDGRSVGLEENHSAPDTQNLAKPTLQDMKQQSPAIKEAVVEKKKIRKVSKPIKKEEVEIVPDMQDLGKAEAYAIKAQTPVIEEPIVEKKKITKVRTTIKKPPTSSPKNLIEQFKKEGLGLLKTLTEDELSGMIDKANQSYYGSDKEIMSDDQYDLLREYVLERFPQNEIAKDGHVNLQMEAVKNKVKLPYEMWSMDKIKPDTGALAKWVAKYSGPYVLSCKLDGVSGMYSTEGSEPKLYTRGNGVVGQDVSHMIPYLRLPKEKGIVIRGEFIIPKDIFEKKYASDFSNPRNFVAGVVNQKKIMPDRIRDLDFVAYEVIKPEYKASVQMKTLTDMDVEVVRFLIESSVSNELLSELLVEWRDGYKYEIDGVICCNDQIYDRKRGNPDHAFAFKMVLGDQIAEAKVVDVIWSASKDGYLKPRVQIEPVVLGGAKIEYATGFNAKFIVDNKIGVGAVISLVRSGDVIPHILSVVRPSPEPMMPTMEYKWNATHVDIVLVDKKADSTVNHKVVTAFFKTIGVDGLGPGNVKKIIAAGYSSIPQIIAMTEEQFMEVDGFKKKLSDKIYNGIREKLSAADLPTIMDATNIFGRGFGTKKFKTILDEQPNIITSKLSESEKVDLVKSISGMAKKTAEKFVSKLPEFIEWCTEAGVTDKLNYVVESGPKINESNPLYGKKIVITGFRDKELVASFEALGATSGSSVSKNTFVVLVKDKDDDTGKADQARKLGITLMTPEEFKVKYNI
uniref:DNA polymerase beta n=1 Tax=viral metagenome TaxID=1070528 RepID=A0A6C0LKA9_9ZZZZ